MRTLISLACRNIFRNRRRTLMTLLVVSGGVAALLVAGGFFFYIFWGFREVTIRNGVGHLQIYDAQFFQRDETRPLELGLEDYRDIERTAEATPHVRGVAPRIEFFGLVSNGRKSGAYMATALLPAAEKKMGFAPNIVAGHDFGPDPAAHEALVGAGLARSMNVQPGGGLTLLAVTADGALNGIDVEVAGLIATGIKEFDDRILQLTLPSAQHLLQTERVTKLVVGLDNTDNTAAAKALLAARLAGRGRPLAVRDWMELSPMYKQMTMMFGGILGFMALIVFFMVVMSSANTLMMAMFERMREIGAMLAMGTPRRWVLSLFVLEGVITGALGAGLGVLLGNGVAALLNHAGIEMPPPPGNVRGFPLHIQHVPELMIVVSFLVIATLAVASVMPAIRASRIKIVEALAHV
ncbi:MAG: FtsX-like permease family protein [Bryobacteraceae bacterium]